MTTAPTGTRTFSSPVRIITALLLGASAIVLRLIWLRSDPYPWLDWSAGLLTDEGFYIHNARNVALFGAARTDGFNNMLLSPLLHFVQVAVFHVIGVGSVQARLISAVTSILTLLVFWLAVRCAFGNRIACIATVFLGLDHSNLLFNRMALMDTPASLPAVAALLAFVMATKASGRHRTALFCACGLMLGIMLMVRSLCGYMLPAPFIALWWGLSDRSSAKRDMAAVLAGLAVLVIPFLLLWYLPNRPELGPMLHFYRVAQVQPQSAAHLYQNIYHAFLGDERGLTPYLFRHTPVVFLLALTALLTGALRQVAEGDGGATNPQRWNPVTLYLVAWLLLGWILLSAMNYGPSRYYVSAYPPLFALAAVAASRLNRLWAAFTAPGRAAAMLRALVAWVATFHLLEFPLHRGGYLSHGLTLLALYLAPCGSAAIFWRLHRQAVAVPPNSTGRAVPALLVVWAGINCAWLVNWVFTLSFAQSNSSIALARLLPPNAVLLGDAAPGICLDNRFVAVTVIPGLCNYIKPLEQFSGRPRYIVVTADGPMKAHYWNKKYPGSVQPENLVASIPAVRWMVELYRVK